MAKRIFLFEIIVFTLILLIPFFYNLIVVKPQLDKFRISLSNYVFDNQIKISDEDRSKTINGGGTLVWKTNFDNNIKNAARIEINTSSLSRYSSNISALPKDMYGPFGTTAISISPSVSEPMEGGYGEGSFRASLILHLKDQRIIDLVEKESLQANYAPPPSQLIRETDGLSYISSYKNNVSWEFDNTKLFTHLNLMPPSINNGLFGNLGFSLEGGALQMFSYQTLTDARNYSPFSIVITVELVLLLFAILISYLLSQVIFFKVNSLIKYNIVFFVTFVPIFWLSLIPFLGISSALGVF